MILNQFNGIWRHSYRTMTLEIKFAMDKQALLRHCQHKLCGDGLRVAERVAKIFICLVIYLPTLQVQLWG